MFHGASDRTDSSNFNGSVVVPIAPDEATGRDHAAIPTPVTSSGSLSVYGALLGSILFHVADFLRITFVTTGLLSRWLIQLFMELDHYNLGPSKSAQQTWLGLVLLGVGASLSLMSKSLNACISGHYFQDYLFAMFSSSLLYFALDIVSNHGSVGTMSLGGFVASSAVCIPLAIAFFLKIAHSDSYTEVVATLAKLKALQLPSYPNVPLSERLLNVGGGLVYAGSSLATFFWTVNREVYGRTMPLPIWQKGLLFLYLLIAGKIGFEVTDHPNFYQTFVAFSKMLKEGSLTYSVMSGIFSLIAVYQCNKQDSCFNEETRTVFSYACFFMAMAIAIYSGATTRFQFQKNHEGHVALIDTIYAAPEKIKSGCADFSNTVSSGASSCAHFFAEKIKQCCAREETVDNGMTEALAAS